MKSPSLGPELIKAWRLLTSPLRFLPDFVIPGSPKCGTSSVYDGLRMHPQFATSRRKEPTNFIHNPGSELRARMNFPFRFEQLWRGPMKAGEASVEYFTHPEAAANVHAIVPGARLIFLFRDPIKRAWSDYQMFQRCGTDTGTFTQAVADSIRWLEDSRNEPLVRSALRNSFSPLRYVYCGAYLENVQRWLQFFPRERCLFLLSEDFFADPSATMNLVFAFLGLPPFQIGKIPHERQGGYQAWMEPGTEKLLRDYFAPRNAQLAEFLGRSLPWS